MNAFGIASCIGFGALLLAYGLFVRRGTARRSGWNRLAVRYPADLPPAGVRYDRATAWINGQAYRDHLTVWISGVGLRLGVSPVFRSSHRPILIPWDDITPQRRIDDQDLVLAIGDSATVTVHGRLALGVTQILSRRSWGRRMTWQA